MLGICEGLAYIYGNNQSVLANTTRPKLDMEEEVFQHCVPLWSWGSCLWWVGSFSYMNINDSKEELPHWSEKVRLCTKNLLHHIFWWGTILSIERPEVTNNNHLTASIPETTKNQKKQIRTQNQYLSMIFLWFLIARFSFDDFDQVWSLSFHWWLRSWWIVIMWNFLSSSSSRKVASFSCILPNPFP